jgi:hypothetical protein
VITAITDEKTGLVLKEPQFIASFTLEDIGGPVRNERPDATGLFSSGRFVDYRRLTDEWGRPGAAQVSMVNNLHSGTMSDDGERFYAASTTAGMFILDTEAIARHTNAEIASGTVCNQRSSNAWMDEKVGGVVDVKKLPAVAADCVHPPSWTSWRATPGSRRVRVSASIRRWWPRRPRTARCRCRNAPRSPPATRRIVLPGWWSPRSTLSGRALSGDCGF